MEPQPEIVDEVPFEETDIADVRERSFPPSQDFFDHGFSSQFGQDEDEWMDEDEDDDEEEYGAHPDCPTQ